MSQLAKLTQITELREIWKHEARDFSKWLSDEENLKGLSDAIGINIVLGEVESAVSFSVDLFATEEGTTKLGSGDVLCIKSCPQWVLIVAYI